MPSEAAARGHCRVQRWLELSVIFLVNAKAGSFLPEDVELMHFSQIGENISRNLDLTPFW
jgi:hypothetical protein